MDTRIDRRRLLQASGITIGAAALGTGSASAQRAAAGTRRIGHPFTLGVASGDPLPDGVVLWTRLAPEPLADDGHGGMPAHPFPVHWEVAEDEGFHRLAQRGTAIARPELAHSVHVELHGLEPARDYYYRFKAAGKISPIGRTRTAPARGTQPKQLRFAHASCQNFPVGYYTAYEHMAEEDLDLVVFLGDYIYEGPSQGDLGRAHVPARTLVTLEDYRIRYAQYKTDPHLQAVHARFPWIVTPDDHEVVNNWADDIGAGVPPEDFLRQRAVAFRAYYEHLPLRSSAKPRGPDMQIYRRLAFGGLVEFNVLDIHQYRDETACGGGRAPLDCPERSDPSRTITGDAQERWLLAGLADSTARWNVLAQQDAMAQLVAADTVSMNFWDGYAASRKRILAGMVERSVRNPVVLTGDIHHNMANNLRVDFNDPDTPVMGVELIGTSITSRGDGSDQTARDLELIETNPHVKFSQNYRGYVRSTVTPQTWRADYRVVPYVSRPGAKLFTRASFEMEDGNPGLHRID